MRRRYEGLWVLFLGWSGVGDTLVDGPWKEGLEPEIAAGQKPGSRAARPHAPQARIETGAWGAGPVKTGASAFGGCWKGPKKGLLGET